MKLYAEILVRFDVNFFELVQGAYDARVYCFYC